MPSATKTIKRVPGGLSGELSRIARRAKTSVKAGFLSGTMLPSRGKRRGTLRGHTATLDSALAVGAATVATFLEYGGTWNASYTEKGVRRNASVTVPPRPFMGDAATENMADWLTIYAGCVLGGRDFAELGKAMQAGIRAQMESGGYAPNGEFWKAFKVGGKPLVDTGALANSVGYKVGK